MPADRKKPWGTGQAVLCCKGVVHEPFAVINADDYYGKEAFKKVHDYLVGGGTTGKEYDMCMAGFIDVYKRQLSSLAGKPLIDKALFETAVQNQERYIETAHQIVDLDKQVAEKTAAVQKLKDQVEALSLIHI